MNVKKLAIIGAIVLVVIGCVLAAGCTSNTTTPTTPVQSSDSIAGVWFSEFTDNAGQKVKETDTVLNNGTAYYRYVYEDGTVKAGNFNWTKNADGTFAVKTSEGQNLTWKLNAAKDTVTSTSGHTFVKKFAENSDAAKIIGVWVDDGKYRLVTFNGDGTGAYLYKGTENSKSDFTWSVSEPGKIKLRYVSGVLTNGEKLAGKESIWTYDHEKDTFTTGGLTGTTHVFVHPTENMDGLTITKFTTDPIVGIWTGDSIDKNGTNVTNIIKSDGTGVTITSYADGTVKVVKMTWKKNTDGTYAFDYSNGTKRVFTVDSTGKTLKTDDGRTKTKQFLDTASEASIVGAWYNKDNNSSFIINGDGTGFYKHEKSISPYTWKMTDAGNITLTFTGGTDIRDGSNLKGETRNLTYDKDNNAIITGGGSKFIRPSESIKDRITLN